MFGNDVIPFWDDEVVWAIRLMRDPLTGHLIRPLGFMAFSKLMADTFGPSEAALRFLPWAASIGTLFLSVPLGRRLFKRVPGQLLFVAIIAFHPDVIDLGKDYKHYSVSLFLHTLLLTLALAYARERAPRWLWPALAAGTLSILFAQDVIFAYPGFYLVLAWCALDAKRYRDLVAIAGAATVTLLMIGALYWFIWRNLSVGGGEETTYWGQKYDVFYVPSENSGSRSQWVAEKYRELAVYPGSRRGLWKPDGFISASVLSLLRSMDAWVWLMLHVLGVGVIFARRLRNEALLLLMPIVVMTAFNLLGYWPFGEFRTNLFVIVYMAAIAAFAISPRAGRQLQLPALVPAGVLVILPLLGFERGWHRAKASEYVTQAEFPTALRSLTALSEAYPDAAHEPLILDQSSCGIWKYYMRLHPSYREESARLRSRFRVRCTWRDNSPVDLARRELERKRRAWFLILDQEGIDRFRASSFDGLRVVERATPLPSVLVGSLEREP